VAGENERSELLIDPEAVRTIIRAAGRRVAAEGVLLERLEACLAEAISRAIRKAPAKKLLIPREMRSVMKAHDRFDKLLSSLQSAGNPPPMLPSATMESGSRETPWTRWMDGLAFRSEKEELLNWEAIGEFLAIYEALFAERIMKANADTGVSHPVSFLKAAFRAVKAKVTAEQHDLARWYYQAPSVSALNERLERLRLEGMVPGELLVRRFTSES
jgi:hypothetical protein